MGFLIIFPYHGKNSKTTRMKKAWEISSHTFSIVWLLFTIRFPSCGILHHMGNAWVSPSISQPNPLYRGKPGKLVLIFFPFSHCMGDFFSIRFPSHGIFHHFGNAWVSQLISYGIRKSSKLGEHRKLVPILSPKYGYFSSIRFTPYGILYHMAKGFSSYEFPITQRNAAKPTQWTLRLFFHLITFSACFKIWWFM